MTSKQFEHASTIFSAFAAVVMFGGLMTMVAYGEGHREGRRDGMCTRLAGVGMAESTRDLCCSWGYDR